MNRHQGNRERMKDMVVSLFLTLVVSILFGCLSGMPNTTPAPVFRVTPKYLTGKSNLPVGFQTPIPATEIAARPTLPIPTPFPIDNTLYDPAYLQQLLLDLINQDRQANGLQSVAWNETAAEAAQQHADDMLLNNYFSHWNLEGLGPDHRYTLAGGQHTVQENLHTFSFVFSNGQGSPIEDWPAVIENAQRGLMNSPGHRANILNPAHTHVGVGMAYDPVTGQFYLVQEFTNHYGTLVEPLPSTALPGSSLQLRGQVNGANLSRLLFSLAYESFPAPLSLQELAQRSTYVSAAQSIEVRALDMVFDEVVILGDQPGLYHVRLFVDIAGEQALVMDHVVWVGQP